MPSDQLGKAEQQRHDDASDTDDFEAAERGVQVLSSLARASPATPIGTVPIAIPKASLSERSEKSRLPSGQRAEQEVAHVTPKIADDRGERGQLLAAEKAEPGSCQPNSAGTIRITTAIPPFDLETADRC